MLNVDSWYLRFTLLARGLICCRFHFSTSNCVGTKWVVITTGVPRTYNFHCMWIRYANCISGWCPGIPNPCIVGKKYADVSNCFFYYECLKDQTLVREYCRDNTAFDIHLSECVLPQGNFDCYTRCIVPDACIRTPFCDAGSVLPDPESCTSFFYCVMGHWGKMDCPSGMKFDKNLLYCIDETEDCHDGCLEFTGPTTVGPTTTPIESGEIQGRSL